jgi:hypothetical protein
VLIILPSPIPELQQAPLPPPLIVTSQGSCHNSLLFHCFHFKLTFESVKELGSASRGACWSFGMRLGRMTSNQSFTRTCTNQITSWLVHNWSIFGAKTSHEQTWTHKTHHGPDLGEATTFPLIVYSVPGHEASTQMSFCLETPKWESRNSHN